MIKENTPKKIILIVEDEDPIVKALEGRLKREKLPLTVLTAQNGKEGLEVALKEHPDLVILDIIMPVMGGIAMLKKLRKDAWGKNAHILLLTNLSREEEEEELKELGVKEYFVKSNMKLEDVIEKIKEETGVK